MISVKSLCEAVPEATLALSREDLRSVRTRERRPPEVRNTCGKQNRFSVFRKRLENKKFNEAAKTYVFLHPQVRFLRSASSPERHRTPPD